MWFNNMFMIYLNNDKSKKLKDKKNMLSWQNTFMRLTQDALNRYEFEGLPETMSERVILESLLWYGCVFFFEKDGNLFALPGAPGGEGFNIYGEPASAYVWGRQGFNQKIKLYIPGSDEASFLKNTTMGHQTGEPKGVFVRENALVYPFMNIVIQYADAISDTMRTIDVCRNHIKVPFVIQCNESEVNTMKKYLKEMETNASWLLVSDVFNKDRVQITPITTAVQGLDASTALVEWYENKFRELCGTSSNTAADKRGENLIMAEVAVNDEYEDLAVDKCLIYIQEGLDNVNKLFGTNITVKAKEKEEKEVEADEDVFGDSSDDTDD